MSTYSMSSTRRIRGSGIDSARRDRRSTSGRVSAIDVTCEAERSGVVVLADAQRHDALQQANLLGRIGHGAHLRQRVPELLQRHEQLLGKDVARARLARDAQERRLKCTRVLRLVQVRT